MDDHRSASDRRRALGIAGEARAAAHLEQRGYRILDRNARAGGVEIDIVAARGGEIVFVEVKTRRSRAWGGGEEAVDARKQARLARGAAAWLRERGARARQTRFDVIVCEPDGRGGLSVRHWEAAFEAGS